VSGRRRPREAGVALVSALLVLLLTATAGALVAADIGLRQRAAIGAIERAQTRALLDAALADALARLADRGTFVGRTETGPAGELTSEVEHLSGISYAVRVTAQVRGRRQAAAAQVERSATGTVRVLGWQRLPVPEGPSS